MQLAKPYRIETGEIQKYTVYLVGCGGTGSFTAFHLARMAWAAPQVKIRLIFIDPDVVELKNVGRQAFAPAEIGQPKAVALARRYSYAFGLQIESRVEPFKADMVQPGYRELCLVIGCVDNPAARREMAKVKLDRRVWYLDSGNWLDGGNIFVGNSDQVRIDPTGFAVEVPRPEFQAAGDPETGEPGLLDDEPAPATETLSCAELLAAEVQSLMINQAMAGWLSVYAYRLILAKNLDIMATYINLAAGSVRSVAVTGEAGRIEVVEEKPPLREGAPAGLVYGLDWDEGELLEIADGACPECGGRLAEGRDTVDEEETDIVFCPNCHWIMAVDELRARIAQVAEEMEPAR